MNLPRWTREPLVHFVALGAIVYVALTWGGSPPEPASRVINVGASEQERIAESWALTMGRAPTDAELDQAIDVYVREEVLYREALRLGLDEGDAVVRQRMVAKMDMSASLAAETAEPTDAVLRAYWETNSAKYAEQGAGQATVSFDQLFFANAAEAKTALASSAQAGETTSLPATIENATLRDIETRFGQQFAASLRGLELGEDWQGPLQSGFGWHLVRLRERTSEPLDFESLRAVLANDWRSDQIKARKERAYEVLREAYRIDIDR